MPSRRVVCIVFSSVFSYPDQNMIEIITQFSKKRHRSTHFTHVRGSGTVYIYIYIYTLIFSGLVYTACGGLKGFQDFE